jgi:uracil-DNA glycosylase family 4
MSDAGTPDRETAARQVRQHLQSLKAAGVEWLPDSPLPTAPPPQLATFAHRPEGDSQPANVSISAAGATTMLPFEQPGPSLSVEDRRQALRILSTTVANCSRCAELAATRTQTVFGVGKIDPEICFIGEAPGADEDAQGEPFVGAAGQLLNRIIAACGMKREDVYICNILKCRPPGNRTPLPNEAANCREYLDKQLELIRPKYICALGACAAQNLLGTTMSIGRLRGQFQSYNGIPVLCTYHPAYLLRSPDKKKEVWEDMQKLLTRMGRPIPRK